jgi:hypothetical protein
MNNQSKFSYIPIPRLIIEKWNDMFAIIWPNNRHVFSSPLRPTDSYLISNINNIIINT